MGNNHYCIQPTNIVVGVAVALACGYIVTKFTVYVTGYAFVCVCALGLGSNAILVLSIYCLYIL